MRFFADETFHRERQRYRLHHTCQHCTHFDHQSPACVHGYPIFDERSFEGLGKEIFYCKEFEHL